MTARISFEHELNVLNQELMKMGEAVEQAIELTFDAFNNHDFQLAENIIKGDRTVNDMERAIESLCLSLMLRQQPVASDLRHISTALKVVTDLERIGDHASDIAELILHMRCEDPCQVTSHFPEMVVTARAMVRDSISAFIKQDTDAAWQITQRDDYLDALYAKVKLEVVELLKEDPQKSDQTIDLLMIAKYLERIGDHAVNVCEWIEFSKTGAVNNVRIF